MATRTLILIDETTTMFLMDAICLLAELKEDPHCEDFENKELEILLTLEKLNPDDQAKEYVDNKGQEIRDELLYLSECVNRGGEL